MKPSELIKVLQKAVDAGLDDETEIFFDTDARIFEYHMAKIGSADFDLELNAVFEQSMIILSEDTDE